MKFENLYISNNNNNIYIYIHVILTYTTYRANLFLMNRANPVHETMKGESNKIFAMSL